ncbi:GIY-YIG nuclease family protein [Cytobacillus sp. FJAT-53684]|uniref:GIY-YIG nuclease family protein n=1 Tax=Cytobacillus mangrovibacter TaxID=3299024 RepID=A0ABW6K298_9BACI
MDKVDIKGFKAYKPIENEIPNSIWVSYGEIEELFFWELEYIPHSPGVYVIYDILGECLYVGCTPLRFNLNGRIKEHLRDAFFKDYAYKMLYYPTEKSTIDMLLLERILIKALTPLFNNDGNDEEISVGGKKYITINQTITHRDYWKDIIEREARRANVPIIIAKLQHDIETVYSSVLDDMKELHEGSINLATLYSKVKEMQNKVNESSNVDLDTFVEILAKNVSEKNFSNNELTYLVLPNKSLSRTFLKKILK